MYIYGSIMASLLVMLVLGAFLGIRLYHARRRKEFVKDFTEYAAVLQYHMEKAYDIIHKDRILVYSLDAVTLTDAEFNRATEDFGRLVIKLLGPMLFKEFVFLYGNEATFSFNIMVYFNTKYEDDEVRKSSLENLSESDESVPQG